MQRLASNQAKRERILSEILDLERWVVLLGDPRPAELTQEAREKFALSLARALQIATTRPIKGRQHDAQIRPRVSGLNELREFLNRAPTDS